MGVGRDSGDPETREVAICVCTYRRNGLLGKLLASIEQLEFATVPADDVEVIVVDNDPDGGAREVHLPSTPATRYVHEPTPGIAAARNRAVAEARSLFIAFVDDDEQVPPQWLDHLVRARREYEADSVTGNVVSRPAGRLPRWASLAPLFQDRDLPTGTPMKSFATGNVLVRAEILRSYRGPFDLRLGILGGSDALLSAMLTRDGHSIVWSREAVVYETVPAERVTRRWLIRRGARTASTASIVDVRLNGRRAALRRRLWRAVAHLGRAAQMVMVGTARGRSDLVFVGLQRLGSAYGTLAPFIGRPVGEYRRRR